MPGSGDRKLPSVTVDVVVVARIEGRQKVLLVKRKKPPFQGQWAIPGGFVEPDEPLESAARRELREETGVEPVYLEQLRTFGDPGRDPRGWTISVSYLARLTGTEARALKPEAGSDAGAVHWFALHDPPSLAFDHAEILAYTAHYLAETDST
jgi:8-oxo-dGTP diphosphatase